MVITDELSGAPEQELEPKKVYGIKEVKLYTVWYADGTGKPMADMVARTPDGIFITDKLALKPAHDWFQKQFADILDQNKVKETA
jgi:hypothetical protein